MNICDIDLKPTIVLAKPININICNHIHRRSSSGVPENPLQIGLDCHVRGLMALKNPSLLHVLGHVPRAAATLGNPLVPGHASLNQRSKNINHQRGSWIFLVWIRIQIWSELSWRDYERCWWWNHVCKLYLIKLEWEEERREAYKILGFLWWRSFGVESLYTSRKFRDSCDAKWIKK